MLVYGGRTLDDVYPWFPLFSSSFISRYFLYCFWGRGLLFPVVVVVVRRIRLAVSVPILHLKRLHTVCLLGQSHDSSKMHRLGFTRSQVIIRCSQVITQCSEVVIRCSQV